MVLKSYLHTDVNSSLIYNSPSVSRSVVSDSVTPWTVTCLAALSMGFPRQEYQSGLPLPSPRDLPNPENVGILHCRQILYHLNYQGSQRMEETQISL